MNNLKKKMNAIISSNGTNNKQLIGKTSKISSSSFLSPFSSLKNENISEFHEVKDDELSDGDNDEKYILLKNENESLLAQIKELTMSSNEEKSKIIDLENRLNAREKELNRINDNLVIDDNRIEFIKYKQEKENELNKIKHLESQIDVLQNEISEKEREIKQYVIKDEIIDKLKNENKKI